jgi:hypothetical protein
MDYRSQAAALFPFQQIDHLAWAKRILWREEHGDKEVTSLQASFARMALNKKPKGACNEKH